MFEYVIVWLQAEHASVRVNVGVDLSRSLSLSPRLGLSLGLGVRVGVGVGASVGLNVCGFVNNDVYVRVCVSEKKGACVSELILV